VKLLLTALLLGILIGAVLLTWRWQCAIEIPRVDLQIGNTTIIEGGK
jgi:hypothetical protein